MHSMYQFCKHTNAVLLRQPIASLNVPSCRTNPSLPSLTHSLASAVALPHPLSPRGCRAAYALHGEEETKATWMLLGLNVPRVASGDWSNARSKRDLGVLQEVQNWSFPK